MIQKWHGSKVNVRIDMDDMMTNNFEIFVKGKGQTYLVHSRMQKNHKLFKEESPEHLEMVKKAVKDIMNGKEPTLPESRQRTGKAVKTAEEREAEAKTREDEKTRKKEETEKRRRELKELRESASKEVEAVKVSEEKKQPNAEEAEKKPKVKRKKTVDAEIPMQKTINRSSKNEKIDAGKNKKKTESGTDAKRKSEPSKVDPLDNLKADMANNSTNSTVASSREMSPTQDENAQDKDLDAIEEGQELSTLQTDAIQERKQHEMASETESIANVELEQQLLVKEREQHEMPSETKSIANVELEQQLLVKDASPIKKKGAEALRKGLRNGEEAKIVDNPKMPAPCHARTQPLTDAQDMLSSFFAFACCRSSSSIDDRKAKDVEDFGVRPEVDACFVVGA